MTEKLTLQMEQLTRHGSKSKQVESELHQAEQRVRELVKELAHIKDEK